MSTKTLMYIGPRPRMVDPLYGTGEWCRNGQPWPDGKLKRVPVDIARKMLAHRDVWVEATPEVVANEFPDDVAGLNKNELDLVGEKDTTKDDTEAEESQKVRDAIAAMDSKQSIADFIAANYSGIKIDKRGSLAAMKQEAVRIVDQYGVNP